MDTPTSFDLLSPGVKRWIYSQGWHALREVQEQSVPVILNGRKDVLITAPTAGGKTEAAFLPILSWLENEGPTNSFGVLCLSPLKALINDQANRLTSLCEYAGTEVTSWHGDIGRGRKTKSWKAPKGILLITPESLEAMFVLRPHELKSRMMQLKYVVVDEYHAFLSQGRGYQLMSLLTRLEILIDHPICRIALSATIGDTQKALAFLRPDRSREGVHLDVGGGSGALYLTVKAYLPQGGGAIPTSSQMAWDLFNWLRGKSNLVFANNRREVEVIATALTRLSASHGLPNEFYAHHGSLSKDVRHYVECRLKNKHEPTTAIATSTLELGIDIGDVDTVVQIGAPSNVSSIKQRLGRSGRREGIPAKLRILASSQRNLKNPSPLTLIEAELFQSIAVIELMKARWTEPMDDRSYELSTLVQQILSMIASEGGVLAEHAFRTLCRQGPWQQVTPSFFTQILRGLGQNKVIKQLPDRQLIVDSHGERILSNHSFYTTFEVPEEYRLQANGNSIGTLPVTIPYVPGQLLLFGGKSWAIKSIDTRLRVMNLVRAHSGQAPIFGGEAAPVHAEIRRKMLALYMSEITPSYCDPQSVALIGLARTYFLEQRLDRKPIIQFNNLYYWFVFESDRLLETLKVISSVSGYAADRIGPCVVIDTRAEPHDFLSEIHKRLEAIATGRESLGIDAQPLGKYDALLSSGVINEAFIYEKIDIAQAKAYVAELLRLNIEFVQYYAD